MRRTFFLLPIIVVFGLVLAACGQTVTVTTPTPGLVADGALAPVDPATVSGSLAVTGSSTVYPLTTRIVEDFAAEGSPAQIDVKVTGTGGGFRSFCGGDPVEIINASRPITDEEVAACQVAGRAPLGFQVAIDALAVVVSNQNTFVETLTFEQLAAIFSGQARRWREVDAAYPDAPINVFSPGVDSGTFDYFVEAVLDGDEAALPALPGAVLSESDTELLSGIEEDPYAIGYFGYAYYQGDSERLRAIAVDTGSGPVAPGEASVVDGTYPLARPLFIYTAEQTLMQRPAVAAFVSYYLQSVGDVVADVGYFPVPEATLSQAQRDLVAAIQ